MKICIFGLGQLDKIGGVQLSYKRLFEFLVAKGVEIVFFSPHDFDRENLAYQLPNEVVLDTFDIANKQDGVKQIKELIFQQDPDVVLLIRGGQVSFIFAAALYNTPYPLVVSQRGSVDFLIQHSWMSKQQYTFAHSVVDFSHLLMPSYRKKLPWSMRPFIDVIPSVIPPSTTFADPKNPSENGRYTILYTGRLAFEKDLDILINAFSKLAHRYPEWDLKLIGDGPEQENLQSLIDSLNLNDRIFLIPSIIDTKKLDGCYQDANIFVLPSRAEGCPISIREAMAHALPVVGFKSCSGVNEIVHHRTSGLLAESNNKVQSLAKAIEMYICDDKLRVKLGLAGAKAIKKYDPDFLHGKWFNLLEKASRYKGKKEKIRRHRKWLNPIRYRSTSQLFKEAYLGKRIKNVYFYKFSLKDIFWRLLYRKAYSALFGSILFNPRFYLREVTSLKYTCRDPLIHFLRHGRKEGTQPSEAFNTQFYVRSYLAESKENPLAHFYQQGRFEGYRFSGRQRDAKFIPKVKAELEQDESKGRVNKQLKLYYLIFPPRFWNRRFIER